MDDLGTIPGGFSQRQLEDACSIDLSVKANRGKLVSRSITTSLCDCITSTNEVKDGSWSNGPVGPEPWLQVFVDACAGVVLGPKVLATLPAISVVRSPGTFNASESSVVLFDEPRPTQAAFTFTGGLNFIVLAYTAKGQITLEDQIGAFNGSTAIPSDTLLLLVLAVNEPWSVTVN